MTDEQKKIKKRIIYRLKHLKYFDSNFSMKVVAINSIHKDDFKEQKRFRQELIVTRKILTIMRYKSLPLTYDIEENPERIITQFEFKKGVLSEDRNRSKEGDKEIGGFECQHLTGDEFEVLDKLIKLQ